MDKLNYFINACCAEIKSNSSIDLAELSQGEEHIKRVVALEVINSVSSAMANNCLIDEKGDFHVFDGREYVVLNDYDDHDEIKTYAYEIIEVSGINYIYASREIVSSIKRDLVNREVKNFKRSRNILSFDNGFLDLETGTLSEHTPAIVPLTYLPFDYNPESEYPIYENYLSEVIGSDQTIDFQEFLSCMFIDKDKLNIETGLIFTGCKDSVKFDLYKVIKLLSGNKMTYLHPRNGYKKQYTGSDIMHLDGKLINIVGCIENLDISKGFIPSFINRDNIEVRIYKKKSYNAVDIPLMIGWSDCAIKVNKSNKDIFDKTVMINVEYSDDTVRPEFDIDSELSGIFNWVMKGRERLIDNNGVFTCKKH